MQDVEHSVHENYLSVHDIPLTISDLIVPQTRTDCKLRLERNIVFVPWLLLDEIPFVEKRACDVKN